MKRQLDTLKTERQDLARAIDMAKQATADARQTNETGLTKADSTKENSFNETADHLDKADQ